MQLTIEVSGDENKKRAMDALPATYHYYNTYGKRAVGDPAQDTPAFLRSELSLGGLAGLLKHLRFAGAARPARLLHSHIAIGGEVAASDRMDIYLLWTNAGKLFAKPVPRFLLSLDFCGAICSVRMVVRAGTRWRIRAGGFRAESPAASSTRTPVLYRRRPTSTSPTKNAYCLVWKMINRSNGQVGRH